MIPAAVDYVRPGTLTEVSDLLVDGAGTAVPLAGGHVLIPAMKLRTRRPGLLVDLAGVAGLAGIDVDPAASVVRVGALTTTGEIERSAALADALPLLGTAASQISDPLIRNRATLGGSLVQGDPEGDWPALATATAATLHLQGPDGRRDVAATAFLAVEPSQRTGLGEVLTAVTFPVTPGVYVKRTHPASGYAALGIAVTGTDPSTIRVGLSGTSTRHLPELDEELRRTGTGSARSVAARLAPQIEFVDDIVAPATFRREIFPVLLQRAISAWRSGLG